MELDICSMFKNYICDMLIDTHSHLYVEQFNEDREEEIARCKSLGIDHICLPNIDVSSIDSLKVLKANHPEMMQAMMGLHPCDVKPESYKNALETIKNELFSNQELYVGVGEIGIDLYWDKSTLNVQIEAFETQINWAKELGKPIVIHARDSFDEIFQVVEKHNDESLFGIFHCFTGNKEQAQKIIDFGGFKMGLGGVLTFKNSGLDKTVSNFSMEHFVLETDAPYLAPTPHRGKRNQSSFLEHIADKCVDVFEISREEVCRITSNNAKEIFKF